jgi:hypothetical protein
VASALDEATMLHSGLHVVLLSSILVLLFQGWEATNAHGDAACDETINNEQLTMNNAISKIFFMVYPFLLFRRLPLEQGRERVGLRA